MKNSTVCVIRRFLGDFRFYSDSVENRIEIELLTNIAGGEIRHQEITIHERVDLMDWKGQPIPGTTVASATAQLVTNLNTRADEAVAAVYSVADEISAGEVIRNP